MSDDSNEWEPLGAQDPTSLSDARLQAHWATQVVSALGATLLEPADDDSHTSLSWDENSRALVGQPVDGLRAGLRLADLTLLLLADDGDVASHGLIGDTLANGRRWLEGALASRGRTASLALPKHGMPMHAVGHDQPFGGDRPALVELARWYANAHRVLSALASFHEAASPVRCWPHHFDIATIFPIGDEEDGRSINAGMSPGDEHYDEPYFYVTPWPAPRADVTFPALGVGMWHHMGWCGAVVTATKLLATEGDQDAIAQRFFRGGVAASTTLVGAPRDSLT